MSPWVWDQRTKLKRRRGVPSRLPRHRRWRGAGSRSSRPRVPGTPAAGGEGGGGLGWCHCCAVLHTQEGRALGSQGAGVLTQPCHRTCVSHGACCSHASSASELRCSWVSTRSKLGLRLGSRCQQAASSVLMPGGLRFGSMGRSPSAATAAASCALFDRKARGRQPQGDAISGSSLRTCQGVMMLQ